MGSKSGLKRETLDIQKGRKINDLDKSYLLATDQKVRSSNLFGRAISPSSIVSTRSDPARRIDRLEGDPG
jgi:hypothetical protein